MIRNLEETPFENGKRFIRAAGLSTDQKPTKGIITGSQFLEVDKRVCKAYDEENDAWEYLSGNVEVDPLTVTVNGTTTAPEGHAYSPVTVNVPNTYTAGDEGKVVSDGALVAQTAHAEVTENGPIDTTLNNSVTVNVSGGGGDHVLVGTDAPSSSAGSEGDVYITYANVGQTALAHTYVLTISKALRGSSSMSYAGATELDLIFDDGNGNDVSITTLSGFTYSGKNADGSNIKNNGMDKLFDGNFNNYFEAVPVPLYLYFTATIPVGYTPKELKVVQRSDSYDDVWQEFTLADTVSGISRNIITEADLTFSDWAGKGNWTVFQCGTPLSGNVPTNYYIKGSTEWTETTEDLAMQAIVNALV